MDSEEKVRERKRNLYKKKQQQRNRDGEKRDALFIHVVPLLR